MGRWEPNARERLQLSALALFLQKGYESTTAAEIAERAGLGKSTFFRHFADKREVLFSGQDELNAAFADAIAAAPAEAAPAEVLVAALTAADAIFDADRLDWARKRQTVIDSSTELIERELLKSATLAGLITDALRKRGVPDPAAAVAAELGNLAFRNAFLRWIGPGDQRAFRALAREEFAAVCAAAADI